MCFCPETFSKQHRALFTTNLQHQIQFYLFSDLKIHLQICMRKCWSRSIPMKIGRTTNFYLSSVAMRVEKLLMVLILQLAQPMIVLFVHNRP